MTVIQFILSKIYRFFQKAYEKEQVRSYRVKYNLSTNVILGPGVVLDGNIFIGSNSYINSGIIQTGAKSKVVIGELCAIGNNVNILAITHDTAKPTGENRPFVERDIIVGNNVWIGSNVYIREGCCIGNNTIIGANSVVVKDVPDNAIVVGNPARIIKYKHVNNGD